VANHLVSQQSYRKLKGEILMRNLTYVILTVLVVTLSLGFASQVAIAGEEMPVTKDVKVLLDNDRVEVVEVNRSPGTVVPMHTHPTLIAYYFDAVTVKHTFKDGKTKVQDISSGELIWKPDGLTHALEVIGPGNQRALVIMIKK
jgi:quercetin dioxygenase-like cupin family protein